MKTVRIALILALALGVIVAVMPAGAQAPPPEWNFVSVDDTSECGVENEGGTDGASVTLERVNIQGMGTFGFDTIARWGSEVLMDELINADYFFDGLHGWGIYDSNDRGMQTMSFADVPPGSTIVVTITLWDSDGEVVLDTDTFSFVCGTAPIEDTPTVPVPGCDVSMTIPSTAVVGTFLADTALHYAPGKLIVPQQVLEAGQSLWVLGVDATGGYYKVLLACGTYWVPVSSMGPTYDDVWNGTPLPTNVVE